VADYTSQEMIVRLAIFVTVCVLASIGIGVGWFWRPHAGHDEPLPADAEAGAELPPPAPWRPVLHHWALLMGAFWLVQVLFFTTFFTNTVQGLASGVSAAWATGSRSRASSAAVSRSTTTRWSAGFTNFFPRCSAPLLSSMSSTTSVAPSRSTTRSGIRRRRAT
jgi:hypothetical protein